MNDHKVNGNVEYKSVNTKKEHKSNAYMTIRKYNKILI